VIKLKAAASDYSANSTIAVTNTKNNMAIRARKLIHELEYLHQSAAQDDRAHLTRVLLSRLFLCSSNEAIVMLGVLQVAFRCD
jgi:hypothetical protein